MRRRPILALCMLIGFDAPESARPGEAVPLRLYWRAVTMLPIRTIPCSFTCSMLRQTGGTGRLREPRGGAYPTSAWVGRRCDPRRARAEPARESCAGRVHDSRRAVSCAEWPAPAAQVSSGDAFTLGVLRVRRKLQMSNFKSDPSPIQFAFQRRASDFDFQFRVAGVALVAVAFALRVYHLGVSDLTFDECASAFNSAKPYRGDDPYLLGAFHELPPAYYVLLRAWSFSPVERVCAALSFAHLWRAGRGADLSPGTARAGNRRRASWRRCS